MKIVGILAGAFLAFGLVSWAPAQGNSEATRVHQEALQLFREASSKQDLEDAAKKFAVALSMFDHQKDKKGVRMAAFNLGLVHSRLGRYDEAAACYQRSLDLSRELKDLKGEVRGLNNLAAAHRRLGRYDMAVAAHERALTIARSTGDRQAEAHSMLGLANVYQGQGAYDTAEDYYQKALATYAGMNDRRNESVALGNLGQICAARGSHDKAIDLYNKALLIKRELKDQSGEGATLNKLGNSYRAQGRYGEAVDCYEKALALARTMGNRSGEANALTSLGNVSLDRAQYDKAMECYNNALAISRDQKDQPGEATALNNLGVVYQDLGEYNRAVEYYEKSLAISTALKNRKGEALTLTALGIVFARWGRYERAVELYESSLRMRRELKDRKGEGDTLNNLGVLYARWGRYDKALDFFEKALAIEQEIKNRLIEGHILVNIGWIYGQKGESGKALTRYREGLWIFQEIGVPTLRPMRLIAGLHLDDGRIDQAESIATELNSQYRDLPRKAGLWALLGRLALAKSEYSAARDAYQRLLEEARDSRNASSLFSAHTGLGLAHEGMGDWAGAAQYYQEAVAHTEELRSILPQDESEAFFDVRIEGFYRTAPYEGLSRVLLRLGRPRDAFGSSEYTRARVFAESISRRVEGVGLGIPPEVLEKDEEINDRLAALRKQRQDAYEKGDKEAVRAVEYQVKELERSLAAHRAMLRDKYPLYAATRYPQPMELSQTALKQDEWVLSYDVTDPGFIVYLTRGREPVTALFKPVPRKELDRLIRTFRGPMEIRGGDDLGEKLTSFDFDSGKHLADLLLKEVLEKLPHGVPVRVVPDDSLSVLPFEMLVLAPGAVLRDRRIPCVSGAQFFGDRNPISYCQSVTALTLARTHGSRRDPRGKILILADPVFQASDDRIQGTSHRQAKQSKPHGAMYRELMEAVQDRRFGALAFHRLPLTGRLAHDLQTLYAGDSTALTGLEATKERFLSEISPTLPQYDNVVFATHGYFGNDLPGIMEPVLVFGLVPPGTDGYLRMSEAMGLRMAADIVVLTACQTGLGRRIAGEGTMGMGRAFQYAGARSVLMSLWSVSEEPSVRLVECFFRRLKTGKGKLDALQLARSEIRNAGFDHPFFWAPFILIGEVN